MGSGAVLEIKGRQAVRLEGPGPWTLGRADSCDIGFSDDPSCSRTQAVIRRSQSEWLLEPRSQVTPTKVNGVEVAQGCTLRDGDRIGFSRQALTFRLSADCAQMAMPRSSASRSAAGAPARAAGTIAMRDNLEVGRQDTSRSGLSQGMLVLDHPTVSRRHARFRIVNGQVTIEDLGSTNGTYVNGRRVTRRVALNRGDAIGIGVFALSFDGQSLRIRAQGDGEPLSAMHVSKVIQPRNGAGPLTLLDHVSVEVNPGELVCIIGESGSGKSTLMNVISGRKRPTGGRVTLGEFDLHAYFDSLKQNMAYVPQSDLLHEALTLRQALTFAAELRLPRDTPSQARARIVEEAAQSVGLTERLDQRITSLSGGQKKRASLAMEILSRPKLLFLDEVTSGLDESTDRDIMALLKTLTQRGMTIVCVTHTLANIEAYADKVIMMAAGGNLAFCGTPGEMLAFFRVRYMGEAFSALERHGAAHWRAQFERATGHNAAMPGVHQVATALPARRREPLEQQLRILLHQFGVLTRRNVALLAGDRRTLIMASVQSLVVGALLGYAYSDFGSMWLQVDNSKQSFLLVLGITCLWIGCAGAAKDIVGELTIYLRERDINLSTIAFVLSKFMVTGAFTVLQIALLMLVCAALSQAIPGPGFEQFLLASAAAIAGVGVGLFISSISNSRDQAAIIVPLALAPQLILGSGLVTALSSFGQWLAKVLIGSYWAREAMISALLSREAIYKVDPNTGMRIAVTAHSVGHSVAALAAQTAGWVGLTIAIMYWRHARKGE